MSDPLGRLTGHVLDGFALFVFADQNGLVELRTKKNHHKTHTRTKIQLHAYRAGFVFMISLRLLSSSLLILPIGTCDARLNRLHKGTSHSRTKMGFLSAKCSSLSPIQPSCDKAASHGFFKSRACHRFRLHHIDLPPITTQSSMSSVIFKAPNPRIFLVVPMVIF